MTVMFSSDARSPMSRPELGASMLRLNAEARRFGVSLEMMTDFSLFRQIVEDIPDRGAITPVFDPVYADIDGENGFWIKGIDTSGEIVHVQALRFDDLGEGDLASHWRANAHLYGPPGAELDIAKTNFHTAAKTCKMTGGVCYHGDFWIHKSFRRLGLAPRLSAFAMLTALARFNPELIYGFIVPKHVRRGLSAQYGYLHIHPWAPQWRLVGREEPYDDYIVWITGEELYELWTTSDRDADVLSSVGQKHDRGLSVVESVPGQ